MSSTVGPVCHIPPTNTPANPQAKAIPGVGPPAGAGSQSQQQVINNLREIILFLTGQQGPAGASGAKAKPARWTEDKAARVTETVRVFQNNDPSSSNYVDVQRINGITMQDGVTGESWKWSR